MSADGQARRVLVTGASGFVGRHTLAPLLAQGFEVHAACRHRIDGGPPEVIWHTADLLDHRAASALVDRVRPSHLLHLAWTVTPGLFWRAAANLDWVAASLLLYRAFAEAGGRRLVVTGTCAEYDWDHALLDEASTPCRPSTLYGVAKHALHQVLDAAARQDGLSLGWGRLFFMYGPHEAPGRLVPDVTLSLLRGQPALCGDGKAERDFMAIEDVAAALVAVLASDHHGAVNIASGRCVPLSEVILGIADVIGRRDLVRLGARPPAPHDPARLAASTVVLHDRIGFRSCRGLLNGLAATVDWWRDEQNAHVACTANPL